MLVGCEKLSWIEMVGKSMGRPPANITPRLTASINWGALPWQGLYALPVLVMPMTGRASAESVKPAPLIKALRKNNENPGSP